MVYGLINERRTSCQYTKLLSENSIKGFFQYLSQTYHYHHSSSSDCVVSECVKDTSTTTTTTLLTKNDRIMGTPGKTQESRSYNDPSYMPSDAGRHGGGTYTSQEIEPNIEAYENVRIHHHYYYYMTHKNSTLSSSLLLPHV